jgi:hypothetical protein
VRWIGLPLMVLPLVFTMTCLVLPTVFAEKPRDVPGDVCALVPADLLARLVPAAGARDHDAENGQQFTNRARCSVRTDTAQATSTARGSLMISLKRHGDLALRDPAEHAQDEFASSKRYRLRRGDSSVFDLRKLGDSAYLAKDRASDNDRASRVSQVEVVVLRKDVELTVWYSAGPSDERLVSSAAVAVAHALLAGLR